MEYTMARDLIFYNNLYKDPDNIFNMLVENGFGFGQAGDMNLSNPIVCGDFVELAQSIVGARVTTFQNEVFGQGIKIATSPENLRANQTVGDRWYCYVFFNKGDQNQKFKTFRHKTTGIRRLTKPFTPTEQNILDGYTGGQKLATKLESDLKNKELWEEECSVSMTHNSAVFLRGDTPHCFPKDYFDKGIVQWFVFGDDNVN
jgi:hypothetical protein